MLLVCSRSTRGFFPEIENVRVITGRLELDLLEEEGAYEDVIAVGGGAVLDAAKILSKGPITCYPTTASGSSHTEHAVVWDKDQKLSVRRHIPKEVIVRADFLHGLPDRVLFETRVDMVSHCFDSTCSKNSCPESEAFAYRALEMLEDKDVSNAELVAAGNLAGQASQITPTTILHSLSYPLTGRHGISHGRALSFFLPAFADFKGFPLHKYIKEDFEPIPSDLDIEPCLVDSLTYKKIPIFDAGRTVDLPFLKGLLGL